MGFLDNLKKGFTDARARASEEISRYKNKDVLQAIVAGCTYIAAADGEISSAEKSKMLGFLRSSPLTAIYGMDEVVKIFEENSKRFEFDHDSGRIEALRIIAKLKGKPEAGMLVRTCIVIGKADGDFDQNERRAVGEIARELDLNPADFDL
ncbi:tellurite resistance TerB family protein [Sphingomonas sp. 3-13AW]|uniref:tellurite resistance TerB family protein n=1 Tax=Sphingomonas sp. 3-13AW TaxID=3050450 RepID=UPI003BB4C399